TRRNRRVPSGDHAAAADVPPPTWRASPDSAASTSASCTVSTESTRSTPTSLPADDHARWYGAVGSGCVTGGVPGAATPIAALVRVVVEYASRAASGDHAICTVVPPDGASATV